MQSRWNANWKSRLPFPTVVVLTISISVIGEVDQFGFNDGSFTVIRYIIVIDLCFYFCSHKCRAILTSLHNYKLQLSGGHPTHSRVYLILMRLKILLLWRRRHIPSFLEQRLILILFICKWAIIITIPNLHAFAHITRPRRSWALTLGLHTVHCSLSLIVC